MPLPWGRKNCASCAHGFCVWPPLSVFKPLGREDAQPEQDRLRPSSKLGADFSQAFAYEGGMVWDFVYA